MHFNECIIANIFCVFVCLFVCGTWVGGGWMDLREVDCNSGDWIDLAEDRDQ